MRHSNKQSLLLAAVALLLLFTRCSGDEDEDDDIGATIPQGFVAKVNGDSFSAQQIEAYFELDDGRYEFIMTAVEGEESGIAPLKIVSLSFFGPDFNAVRSGSSFNNNNLASGSGALCLYWDLQGGLLNINSYLASLLGGLDDGTRTNLKIASIDRTNQTISGTFSAEFVDQDSGQRYEITDGRFGQIPYEIEE